MTAAGRAARYRAALPGVEAGAGAVAGVDADVVEVKGERAGARCAALDIADAAAAAIARAGRFRLAVPGGRTAAAVYEALAARPGPAFDPAAVDVAFVDERAVPADDPESNYALARSWLCDRLGVPVANLARLAADAPDLERVASDYDAWLARPLDLVFLGIGEDGHFASLFPRSPLLAERTRRVAIERASPKPPPVRLTITPRVLAEAERVIVLATGPEKAALVPRVFATPAPGVELPAGMLRGAAWIVDPA